MNECCTGEWGGSEDTMMSAVLVSGGSSEDTMNECCTGEWGGSD